MKKAVILLSGGVDSTVCLAMAIEAGYDCYCLGFDYFQNHRVELAAAKKVADFYEIPFTCIRIDPAIFSANPLITGEEIPKNRSLEEIGGGIAPTFLPGRNTLFLSSASSYAAAINAEKIYIGVGAVDDIPYPDCRQRFINAFQQMMNVSTDETSPEILTPLIGLTKEAVVREGRRLNAPLELTHSCYDPLPNREPCNVCDTCLIRIEAFKKVCA